MLSQRLATACLSQAAVSRGWSKVERGRKSLCWSEQCDALFPSASSFYNHAATKLHLFENDFFNTWLPPS